MKRGKLITFEGCEGVGKSTQIRLLKEYLQKQGEDAVYLREPGGTPISEKIRAIILAVENGEMSGECEVLLYSAARAQLIQQVIEPALQAGKTIICDRYIDSTLAYQGHARGLGIGFVNDLNRLTVGPCMPDATVFLDLEPKSAFKRKGGADPNDRLELETIEFHQKVYEGYQIAIQGDPARFIRIVPEGTKFETNLAVIRALEQRGLIGQ